MDKKRHKESVRLGLQKAGRNYKEIAEETGIPYGSIKTFASSGHLSKDKLAVLQKYLAERGALAEDIDATFRASDTKTAISHVAGDLRLLADVLLDPGVAWELKAANFRGTISSYYTYMESIIELMKKQSETAE